MAAGKRMKKPAKSIRPISQRRDRPSRAPHDETKLMQHATARCRNEKWDEKEMLPAGSEKLTTPNSAVALCLILIDSFIT
jgi:hypothetical protein